MERSLRNRGLLRSAAALQLSPYTLPLPRGGGVALKRLKAAWRGLIRRRVDSSEFDQLRDGSAFRWK